MVFNRKPDMTSPPGIPPYRSPDTAAMDRPAFSNSSYAPPEPEAILESVIGNDLSIEGDTITIRCKGSLKILGNIQADLHSKRLEVGKEAVISGAIAADNIDVFGRVQGSILGARVVLHAGAEVEGDIMSQLLSVEEGANFDGRSRRVTDAAAITPQLEKPGSSPAAKAPPANAPMSQAQMMRSIGQAIGPNASPLN